MSHAGKVGRPRAPSTSVGHRRNRTKQNHPCEKCNLRFDRPVQLNNHMRVIHDGERPHPCSDCSKSYCYPVDLARHKQRDHVKENNQLRFVCRLCPKVYSRGSSLNDHHRKRHGDLAHPDHGNFGSDRSHDHGGSNEQRAVQISGVQLDNRVFENIQCQPNLQSQQSLNEQSEAKYDGTIKQAQYQHQSTVYFQPPSQNEDRKRNSEQQRMKANPNEKSLYRGELTSANQVPNDSDVDTQSRVPTQLGFVPKCYSDNGTSDISMDHTGFPHDNRNRPCVNDNTDRGILPRADDWAPPSCIYSKFCQQCSFLAGSTQTIPWLNGSVGMPIDKSRTFHLATQHSSANEDSSECDLFSHDGLESVSSLLCSGGGGLSYGCMDQTLRKPQLQNPCLTTSWGSTGSEFLVGAANESSGRAEHYGALQDTVDSLGNDIEPEV